jgi:hypothetical protein
MLCKFATPVCEKQVGQSPYMIACHHSQGNAPKLFIVKHAQGTEKSSVVFDNRYSVFKAFKRWVSFTENLEY